MTRCHIIRLQKIVVSILRADSLAGFDEASCHVGEAQMTRNWGCPPTNTQQGLRLPIQPSWRNWILPSTAWAWKRILPSWHLRWSQLDHSLVRDLKPRPQLSLLKLLWPKGNVRKSVCCFKLLSFGIVCYAAINNIPSAPKHHSVLLSSAPLPQHSVLQLIDFSVFLTDWLNEW